MTNFTDMLSKAKEMQKKMKNVQEAIKKIEVEGESGGNLVKVILTGDYELKSIIIKIYYYYKLKLLWLICCRPQL